MKALFAALLLVGVSFAAHAEDQRHSHGTTKTNYVLPSQGGMSAGEYFSKPEAWYTDASTGYTSAAQAEADLEARNCLDVEGGTGGHYCAYEAKAGSRGARVDRRQADPNWQTMRACGYTFASLRAATYSCPEVAQVRHMRAGYVCDCRDYLLRD